MAAPIVDLLATLRQEVDRVVEKRGAHENKDELSEILLNSIHKTLREIKLGADSDEFQDLAVINFVITADDAGYPTETINSFLQEFKEVKKAKE